MDVSIQLETVKKFVHLKNLLEKIRKCIKNSFSTPSRAPGGLLTPNFTVREYAAVYLAKVSVLPFLTVRV